MIGNTVSGLFGQGLGRIVSGVVIAEKAGLGLLVRVEARPGYDHLPYGDQDRGLYVFSPKGDRFDVTKWTFGSDEFRLDEEHIANVTAQFLATPTWEEQADAMPTVGGGSSCYYCGCPATGWSMGERACTGCGG